MKKTIIPLLLSCLTLAFVACKKDSSENTPLLEASKTSAIRKGEPVVFSLPQAAAGNAVTWTVQPATNTRINSDGKQASILFGTKGSYTVTAMSGNLMASRQVSVSDSVYNGGGQTGGGNGGGDQSATTLPLQSGEKIQIQVARIDSGSTSGLIFTTATTNSYACLSNSLLATTTNDASGYRIEFTGVLVPANCTSGTARAAGFAYLYPIPAGNTALTIKVNGTTYTGTITRNGSAYTISWPQTSGAVITPTSL